MADLLLTLNAGSSSVKFAVFAEDAEPRRIASGQVENLKRQARFAASLAGAAADARDLQPAGPATHAAAVDAILGWVRDHVSGGRVSAVGHRVVHGGATFPGPVRVDEAVLATISRLIPLAPLHQPHNVAAIEAARARFPGVPQIACFDTAFHRGQPFVADAFALPRALYEEGVRRYGFHGLSYESIVRRLRAIAPGEAAGNVIVAHLGNGASACAIRDGVSMASTMGFTALDGLPMGTRSGQIDPGVLLYLMAEKGMDGSALTDLLYNRSGLLGLSGVSNDMRELEASDHPAAAQAIAYFTYRIRREVGSLAAALGGVGTLVFTGGIGEHSVRVRRDVTAGLGWLGVRPDAAANQAGAAVVSAPGSLVTVRVVPTDEELTIALQSRALAGG